MKMGKNGWFAGILVGIALLVNFLLPTGVRSAEKVVNLRWAGAGEGSSLYLTSLAIADIINKNSKRIRITVEVSPGSEIVPRMIEEGQVLIGPAGSIAEYSAVNGLPPYSKPTTKVRRFFIHAQFLFAAFCLKEKPISQLADLNGKTVGIGPLGTPAAKNAELLIKYVGDQVHLSKQSNSERDRIERIKDGIYDAGMYSTGHPWAGLLEMMSVRNGRVFGLTGDEQQKFLKVSPINMAGTIRANTYSGQTEDVKSFGSLAGFGASSDLPEDIAYEILTTLEKNYKELLVAAPAATSFLNWEIQKKYVAPFHPGTIRWLKEHGVAVQTS